MKPAQSNDNNIFISLKKASHILGVSIEVLLEWNDLNILKPTITQSGEIGYTKEQLTKFIELQKNFHQPVATSTPTAKSDVNSSIPRQHPIAQEKAQVNQTTHLQPKSQQPKSSDNNIAGIKLASVGFLSFLIVVGISFSSKFIGTNQGNRPEHDNALITTEVSGYKESQKVQDVSLPKSSISMINVPFIEFDSVVNNENKLRLAANILGDKSSQYQKVLSSFTSNGSQGSSNDIIDQKELEIISNSNNLSNLTIGSGLLTNFAARSNVDNLNDASGINPNILDQENSEMLATSLDTLVQPSGSKTKGLDLIILIIFSVFSFFLVIYHFNSLTSLVPIGNDTSKAVPPQLITKPLIERVFEVSQKADGTVVIYHKSEQFKISKPELNSETDQLIQRLMSLSKDGKKEIKYDILKDERLDLNAPLSKVVTRLGFVGIKRDLFFPRTSKNKVIFRKYVTENDLAIMNISKENILDEIIKE